MRSCHLVALVKLSKASQRYPRCLVLPKEVRQDPDPVSGGSFGEIFAGHYQGHAIALKVLRIYKKADSNKVLQVRANINPYFQFFTRLYRKLIPKLSSGNS